MSETSDAIQHLVLSLGQRGSIWAVVLGAGRQWMTVVLSKSPPLHQPRIMRIH
jgi:hypothetical protein